MFDPESVARTGVSGDGDASDRIRNVGRQPVEPTTVPNIPALASYRTPHVLWRLNSSGSFATLAAMRRASSLVSSLASMSALPPKADIVQHGRDVRFVPKADILRCDKVCCYSITSSARCWSCTGTSRPRALAVLTLITSSNLTGASTGSSLGFAPRRMRSA